MGNSPRSACAHHEVDGYRETGAVCGSDVSASPVPMFYCIVSHLGKGARQSAVCFSIYLYLSDTKADRRVAALLAKTKLNNPPEGRLWGIARARHVPTTKWMGSLRAPDSTCFTVVLSKPSKTEERGSLCAPHVLLRRIYLEPRYLSDTRRIDSPSFPAYLLRGRILYEQSPARRAVRRAFKPAPELGMGLARPSLQPRSLGYLTVHLS